MANENVNLVIKNTSILNENYDIEENKTIVIHNSKILEIEDSSSFSKYIPSETIDGKNKLFMPGLVDGHMHTCQQLLRGRIMDEYPMIWKRIMIPFESNLTKKDVKISSEAACLEMIKAGTTSFADAGGIFMDSVAETTITSGLRASLTCSTMDQDNSAPQNMLSTENEAIEKNTTFFNNFNNEGDGRLKVYYSLRTLLSCSESLIINTFNKSREYKTGIHIHMNEYPNEINYCLENFQKRPIEYLDSLGLLGPNLLSAHSILLSEKEIDLLKVNDVKVIHCPISNFGKGIHKTPRLLESGISVGLGTDGTAHAGMSLFNEIKVFRSVMHAYLGVPISDPIIMPAKTLLKMATIGGSKAMMNDDVGVLSVGKKADLISIDLNQPHISPSHNLTNTIVEVATSNDVRDMIVNGKLIMKDREVLTLDEEKILHESKLALNDLKDRAGI